MGQPSVLVLGANGMLGHAVLDALSARKDWSVDGTQVEEPEGPFHLDAEEAAERWAQLFSRKHYDYAVNCIGVLKPAIDEHDSVSMRRAITVNALFPHRLAEVAGAAGTRVIHMSTDGVFSCASANPRVETDPADCPDVYGKTKALGECRAPNVLNIRCSIIGRDPVWRKGLIEWVLSSPGGSKLPGFEDQTWNGVTTVQFANLCRGVIEAAAFERIRQTSAVHHFCPNPTITKYELLCHIQKASGSKVTIRRAQSETAAGSRVLATRFNELAALYPGGADWAGVIRKALEDTPE